MLYRPSEDTLEIVRLDGFEKLPGLAAEWEDFLETVQMESIFVSYDWLAEWWRVYGVDQELWLLTARLHGSLKGIAPLMLTRDASGVRRICFIGTGKITPNQLDFIVLPDLRPTFMAVLCEYLINFQSFWDILDINCLTDNVSVRELLLTNLRAHGLKVAFDRTVRCPYSILPSTFNEYLQSRGSATRQQYRAKLRRLKRDHPEVTFGLVASWSQLDETFDALIRLHQARWTRRGQSGSFASKNFIDFHRAAARTAFAKGRLRLYYLKIDDSFAAIYYCFQTGRKTTYYNAGFDENWQQYSVGILTLAFAIEQSIAHGSVEFDFLQGDEAYKAHWATDERWDWRIQAASGSWRGRRAWFQMQVKKIVRAWGSTMPDPIKRTVKLLRRRAS